MALKGNIPPVCLGLGETSLDSSMRNYYELGLSPGGMLTKLLSNDVFGAWDSCHPNLKGELGLATDRIRAYIPRYCYGDPDTVQRWIDMGGIEGWQDAGNDWECPWTMHTREWSKYYIDRQF